MTRHFILYWRPETVEHHLACDFLLRNAGSSQLGRVGVDDALWIVTTGEGDELGLAGRLRVGAVVTLAEAKRLLGTEDLWPSPLHALSPPGAAEPMRGVTLAGVAADLRFVGEAVERFVVTGDGEVHPRQLITMLEVTPESAAVLERLWLKSSAGRR